MPGARLSGGGVFESDTAGNPYRRLYVRGSDEHVEARDAGLVERLPPLVTAPPEAVDEAERALGFPLPTLLRRLYLEIGNGGLGPGYGLLGLRGGHRDDLGGTAIDVYREWRERHSGDTAMVPIPEGLLPICHWGCGIYSLIDCASAEADMWASDPNPGVGNDVFREPTTFGEWLERWIEGRLHQPALIEDPVSGDWRGATDEDWADWAEETS